MQLTSQIYTVVKKYTGKSKFDFWNNLEVGHTFGVSTILKRTMNRRGNYAISLRIKNLNTGEEFNDTMNSFLNYLSKIEYH